MSELLQRGFIVTDGPYSFNEIISVASDYDHSFTVTPDAQIKRGQYIVQRVSMCGDCHTPKTDKGEYDMTAWLAGDVLDFKPSHPMPFAAVAPQIAGLPTMPTDEMAIRFFETGTNATGKLAMPPMPRFRFEHDDAVAVVAYLRSLKK